MCYIMLVCLYLYLYVVASAMHLFAGEMLPKFLLVIYVSILLVASWLYLVLGYYSSQVTSAVTRAIARNLASALEQETATCYLVFQAIREPPRKKQ
jgi:hypothetical protein